MNAATFAKVACTSYCCQQLTFFMYHYNSYAANPILLRSPKPMVMRDFFLIKATPLETWHVFNPLSSLYVLTFRDSLWNCVAAWAVGYRLVETLGFRTVFIVYVLGGMFSSFAYVFQMQCSKTKKRTDFDCASMSSGAMAALCSLSLLMPPAAIPFTKGCPTALFSIIFITKTLLEEYGPFMRRGSDDDIIGKLHFQEGSRLFVDDEAVDVNAIYRDDGAVVQARSNIPEIQLNNWGGVGGIFLGIIYGSVVLGAKRDMMQIRKFWSNIPKGKATQ
eukprot:Tbor_TRINITY_DN2357_c0_g1::TRINITY_DN2357_c0_g1_i1::g.196::m.196